MPEQGRRTKFYKAAQLDLNGPHRRSQGGLYVPGSTHEPDWLDPDEAKSCTHGLYYTSHRRVAARWGPVVLEVQVLGTQIKTNDKVRPSAQPYGVEAGKYQKYRTDLLRVVKIIGVTGYSPTGQIGSRADAVENIWRLNETLASAGLAPVQIVPGPALEVLRSENFQLWPVADPNAVTVTTQPSPLARHRVEGRRLVITFDQNAAYPVTDTIDAIYRLIGQQPGVNPGSQRVEVR